VRSRESGDGAGATATTADDPLSTTTTSSSDVTPHGPCVCTAPSVTDESRCDVESAIDTQTAHTVRSKSADTVV